MAADPPSASAGVLRAVAVRLLVLGSEVTGEGKTRTGSSDPVVFCW
jgi:hypothetical protein